MVGRPRLLGPPRPAALSPTLHPSIAASASAPQLPGPPETKDRPNFKVSKAPNLKDGGDCHQDRQSCHDHIQPSRRGCLPFRDRLVSLDCDPQAVYGIAGGPLAERDVVCHGSSPGRAQPAPRALQPVARLVVYSASCEGHGNDVAPRMVDVQLTDSTRPARIPILGACRPAAAPAKTHPANSPAG